MIKTKTNPLARHTRQALLAAGVVLVLTGCASKVRLDPPAPVENRSNSASTVQTPATGAASSGVSQSRITGVDLSGANGGVNGGGALDGAAGGSGRVVYFDYDSYIVREADRGVVDSNARWLNADRKRAMLLEGHTDERGGSEYNLALGQRRAEAVARALTLLGVKDGQLEAVSYGKEHPAVSGSNEAAWAKNRRVELKERR